MLQVRRDLRFMARWTTNKSLIRFLLKDYGEYFLKFWFVFFGIKMETYREWENERGLDFNFLIASIGDANCDLHLGCHLTNWGECSNVQIT